MHGLHILEVDTHLLLGLRSQKRGNLMPPASGAPWELLQSLRQKRQLLSCPYRLLRFLPLHRLSLLFLLHNHGKARNKHKSTTCGIAYVHMCQCLQVYGKML